MSPARNDITGAIRKPSFGLTSRRRRKYERRRERLPFSDATILALRITVTSHQRKTTEISEKSRLHSNPSMSAMAFHENAGPRQVDLICLSRNLPFLHDGRVFRAARSGQGRVLCGVSEPLTARTDRSPFRQEGKGQSLGISCLFSVLALRPNPPCRHPSIRTLR